MTSLSPPPMPQRGYLSSGQSRPTISIPPLRPIIQNRPGLLVAPGR